MTLQYCNYDEEYYTRAVIEGLSKHKTLPVAWRAYSTEDDLHGDEVLAQARAATPGTHFDPVPKIGAHFEHHGHEVDDAKVKSIRCELEDPKNPHIWIIRAEYGPPEEGDLQLMAPKPANPLQWPVTQWMEYIEDQVVVESAYCLTLLTNARRGPNSQNEPGPIINGAGQQTIDPQTELDYRIIFNTTINYPNGLYAIALNNQFRKTVHAPPKLLTEPLLTLVYPNFIDTNGDYVPELDPSLRFPYLMGCPHVTWKFLLAEPDKPQFREVEGLEDPIEFYPTTVKLEYKLGERKIIEDPLGTPPTNFAAIDSGWLRLVLNNGQLCFRRWYDGFTEQEEWIWDPRFPPNTQKMLCPTVAMQPKEGVDLGYNDTRDYFDGPREITIDDMEEVATSEPVNLLSTGEQINLDFILQAEDEGIDPRHLVNHIIYLNLRPANYYHITDYYGNSVFPAGVTLPTFPLTAP